MSESPKTTSTSCSGIAEGEENIDRDGIRTRAPYEIGALIQRLRPTRPPDLYADDRSGKNRTI